MSRARTLSETAVRFKLEQQDDAWHVWLWRGNGWIWSVYVSLDAALEAIRAAV